MGEEFDLNFFEREILHELISFRLGQCNQRASLLIHRQELNNWMLLSQVIIDEISIRNNNRHDRI